MVKLYIPVLSASTYNTWTYGALHPYSSCINIVPAKTNFFRSPSGNLITSWFQFSDLSRCTAAVYSKWEFDIESFSWDSHLDRLAISHLTKKKLIFQLLSLCLDEKWSASYQVSDVYTDFNKSFISTVGLLLTEWNWSTICPKSETSLRVSNNLNFTCSMFCNTLLEQV